MDIKNEDAAFVSKSSLCALQNSYISVYEKNVLSCISGMSDGRGEGVGVRVGEGEGVRV